VLHVYVDSTGLLNVVRGLFIAKVGFDRSHDSSRVVHPTLGISSHCSRRLSCLQTFAFSTAANSRLSATFQTVGSQHTYHVQVQFVLTRGGKGSCLSWYNEGGTLRSGSDLRGIAASEAMIAYSASVYKIVLFDSRTDFSRCERTFHPRCHNAKRQCQSETGLTVFPRLHITIVDSLALRVALPCSVGLC